MGVAAQPFDGALVVSRRPRAGGPVHAGGL